MYSILIFGNFSFAWNWGSFGLCMRMVLYCKLKPCMLACRLLITYINDRATKYFQNINISQVYIYIQILTIIFAANLIRLLSFCHVVLFPRVKLPWYWQFHIFRCNAKAKPTPHGEKYNYINYWPLMLCLTKHFAPTLWSMTNIVNLASMCVHRK
jgi:hypothetical protein